MNSGASLTAAEFEDLPIRYLVGENTDLKDYAVVQSVGVSLSISWSDLLAGPYVSAITVMIDSHPVATVTSPAQAGQAILSSFNFDHPLFQRYRDADAPPDPEEELPAHPLADEILDLSRQMSISGDVPLPDYRVGIQTFLGALPEATENEVPPGALGLSPGDLSVIYVESGDGGVRFRPLRVSPDGDFLDRWPHGFFAERAEELF